MCFLSFRLHSIYIYCAIYVVDFVLQMQFYSSIFRSVCASATWLLPLYLFFLFQSVVCYVDAIFFPLFMLQIDCFMPFCWWRFGFRYFRDIFFLLLPSSKSYRTVNMECNYFMCLKCDKNALTIFYLYLCLSLIHYNHNFN